ncbi:MAG: cycloisomerase [Acidobacteria bacterium]|nr:MAG: cycloisomerase [Acidobacteriota bacterium]
MTHLVLLFLQLVSTFDAAEARQGVAVDAAHFYAIDSRVIGKYDKMTGKQTARWQAAPGSTITHLDSGVVVDGKLYCAHSNYPGFPMKSSVEIWDTGSLTHIGTHDFGVRWGSLTWVDRHNGFWWATFANYDQVIDGKRYGGKENTVLVKLNDKWQDLQTWTFPSRLLSRFGEMSNSGGSWGTDGRLYLTGHDAPEIYVVRLGESGGMLEFLETIPAPIAGQGIAWDRSTPGHLYGILRAKRQVTVLRLL